MEISCNTALQCVDSDCWVIVLFPFNVEKYYPTVALEIIFLKFHAFLILAYYIYILLCIIGMYPYIPPNILIRRLVSSIYTPV